MLGREVGKAQQPVLRNRLLNLRLHLRVDHIAVAAAQVNTPALPPPLQRPSLSFRQPIRNAAEQRLHRLTVRRIRCKGLGQKRQRVQLDLAQGHRGKFPIAQKPVLAPHMLILDAQIAQPLQIVFQRPNLTFAGEVAIGVVIHHCHVLSERGAVGGTKRQTTQDAEAAFERGILRIVRHWRAVGGDAKRKWVL